MRRAIGLILLAYGLVLAGAAQAQPRSLDDLFKQNAPTGVYVTDPIVQPDGPPTVEDTAYENRVLSTFRSAQAAQGALDGRWEIRGADGAVIYLLQFTDPGAGPSRIEGVWRDPQKLGADSSGFVDSVTVDGGGETVLVFRENGAASDTQVRVRTAGNARYSGQARTPQGSRTITMVRAPSIEARALGGG